MSKHWTEYRVQDFIDVGEAELKTGPFGTQLKADDYVDEGTPVINVRNIGFGKIREGKLEHVEGETLRRLSSHLLQSSDIVFGRKGAVERHAIIDEESAGWMQGSDCLRLRLSSPRVNNRFLSYLFLTDRHQRWMTNQCSHGATMASLNQDIISRVPLYLPPLPVQRCIASILSAYDDLIAVNERRIALLEQMAQAVYREWFVHFRYPGHEDAEMQDTEALGPVPAGWDVAKLKDVANVNRANVQKDDAPEEIHYITISCVNEGNISDIERMPWSESPSRAKRIVQHGDILWSKVRPNLKGYGLILNPAPDTIASTGFAVISPDAVPYSYLYPALTTEDFVSFLTNRTSGATYPAVKVRDFKNAKVPLPPEDVLDAYDEKVRPLYELKERLAARNGTLRRTRDLLLPRLVSGEVAVEPETVVSSP